MGAALIYADRRKDMPLFGTVRIHLQRDSWVEDTELNDGNTYFREFKLRVCKKNQKLTGYLSEVMCHIIPDVLIRHVLVLSLLIMCFVRCQLIVLGIKDYEIRHVAMFP